MLCIVVFVLFEFLPCDDFSPIDVKVPYFHHCSPNELVFVFVVSVKISLDGPKLLDVTFVLLPGENL